MEKVDLSQEMLKKIVDKIKTEKTRAIIMVGSYARGNAKKDSDIDITQYVEETSDHNFVYQVIGWL